LTAAALLAATSSTAATLLLAALLPAALLSATLLAALLSTALLSADHLLAALELPVWAPLLALGRVLGADRTTLLAAYLLAASLTALLAATALAAVALLAAHLLGALLSATVPTAVLSAALLLAARVAPELALLAPLLALGRVLAALRPALLSSALSTPALLVSVLISWSHDFTLWDGTLERSASRVPDGTIPATVKYYTLSYTPRESARCPASLLPGDYRQYPLCRSIRLLQSPKFNVTVDGRPSRFSTHGRQRVAPRNRPRRLR